ncbi:hypothetical protein [Corynebacterium flavescens]|uniref:Uncharacterized protein n=2 Tax=Corynebacterium flavescens TaxID=28028 RepID=A0AB73B442_CORFL|nr:hypothetical protein [Corynebacterium flavescens]KAA8722751.1 hypothetical protein F4V60_04815 [Corynebacterium flavescens]GEB96653.1 hypothetical protein CFL01nite_01480 [Corynebacterium flavescens]
MPRKHKQVQRHKRDRTMWAMSPERLEQHLQLRKRAVRIPDKKKQAEKKACRNTNRQAFGLLEQRRTRVAPRIKPTHISLELYDHFQN